MGSEMCIRDSNERVISAGFDVAFSEFGEQRRDHVLPGGSSMYACLLYTSDAADERSSVDLGGRRIIKKKKNEELESGCICDTNKLMMKLIS